MFGRENSNFECTRLPVRVTSIRASATGQGGTDSSGNDGRNDFVLVRRHDLIFFVDGEIGIMLLKR